MIPIVAYSSPFVPPEWIAAHGLDPLRVVVEATPHHIPEGVCPFAAAFAERRGTGGPPVSSPPSAPLATILATTCDQMRRIAEQVPGPTFLMNIPATWQTENSQILYINELHRLSRFLIQLGGTIPTPAHLIAVMHEYDQQRQPLRQPPPIIENLPRLALVGGPLRRQDHCLFDFIRSVGGQIVLDATETGQRTLPAPFDPSRMHDNPLTELARAYFGSIPDAFRRPDTQLHEYLRREILARDVQAIILVRYIWCDQWHAQLGRLRETLPLPIVEIDLAGLDSHQQRIRTRIESLVSILR